MASLGSMIMKGWVRIFFARAAYRNVFRVSAKLEAAGDTHAINRVMPFPDNESANNFVNLLSRYGT